MQKIKKSYGYKFKLPGELAKQLQYFANQWNEEFDLCLKRTLKAGLIARKWIKEKHRRELYKTKDLCLH